MLGSQVVIDLFTYLVQTTYVHLKLLRKSFLLDLQVSRGTDREVTIHLLCFTLGVEW